MKPKSILRNCVKHVNEQINYEICYCIVVIFIVTGLIAVFFN